MKSGLPLLWTLNFAIKPEQSAMLFMISVTSARTTPEERLKRQESIRPYTPMENDPASEAILPSGAFVQHAAVTGAWCASIPPTAGGSGVSSLFPPQLICYTNSDPSESRLHLLRCALRSASNTGCVSQLTAARSSENKQARSKAAIMWLLPGTIVFILQAAMSLCPGSKAKSWVQVASERTATTAGRAAADTTHPAAFFV